MERREVVNAQDENSGAEWAFSASPPVSIQPAASAQFPSAQSATTQFPLRQSSSRPACLYLGPGGERCDRPALDSGFCAQHQLNPSAAPRETSNRTKAKKAAAVAGVLAALWPLILDLIRELMRLFR
jgi:hypothetical protein